MSQLRAYNTATGEFEPINGTDNRLWVLATLAAGTAAIGDVDVTSLPSDPLGANDDAIVAAGAVGSLSAKLRRVTQGLEDLKTLIALASGTNGVGYLITPTVPAETVVAGAASTLGKIGTVPAGVELFVRVPCATTSPATALVDVRVSCNKAHSVRYFRARSILNAPTITLASVQASDTVIINGLTFTAHANTTTVANREFKIDGATDTLDADELVTCVNDATYGVPGLTAAAPAAVLTLTATTATITQCTTGVGGARIVCAQNILTSLAQNGPTYSGRSDNTTKAGDVDTVEVLGYPHLYVGITNNDGAAAATVVVGATLLAA